MLNLAVNATTRFAVSFKPLHRAVVVTDSLLSDKHMQMCSTPLLVDPEVLSKDGYDGHGGSRENVSSYDIAGANISIIERIVPLPIQRHLCEAEINTLNRLQWCLVSFKNFFGVIVDFMAAFFIDVVELVAVFVFIIQNWLLNKEREKRSILIGLSDTKLAEIDVDMAETLDIRKRNAQALDRVKNELKKGGNEPIQSAHEAMLEELKVKCQEQINPELLLPSKNTASEDMEPSSGMDIELRGWAATLLDHIRDNSTITNSSESKLYGFHRIGDNRTVSGHSRYQLRKYTSFIY